jgi:arylsulfatase A-like enzyme
MPSFASIFTGLYPEEHGAEERVSGLAASHLTLAEILRERGYRTMAVVSGEYVTTAVGMLQGFEITDESHISGADDVTSAAVTDRARDLLSRHGGEPFFLFAHYFDPHFSYQRHPEFGFSTGLGGSMVRPGTPKLEPLGFPHHGPEFDELKARYAEEIAFTDRQIGRLLTLLDDRHLWDSTCVIFVADHGEEFAEHGGFEHGDTLFNELIHVPLLVADPARPGPAVRDDVVETRSLFSTALERLGLRLPVSPVPPPTLTTARKEGQDFARSSARGVGSCLTGPRYKLMEGGGSRGAGLTLKAPPDADWRQLAAGRRQVLFDLLRDPRETTNLSLMRPDIASRLHASLEAIARGLRPQANRASRSRLDDEQLRKLRDLGYLK